MFLLLFEDEPEPLGMLSKKEFEKIQTQHTEELLANVTASMANSSEDAMLQFSGDTPITTLDEYATPIPEDDVSQPSGLVNSQASPLSASPDPPSRPPPLNNSRNTTESGDAEMQTPVPTSADPVIFPSVRIHTFLETRFPTHEICPGASYGWQPVENT